MSDNINIELRAIYDAYETADKVFKNREIHLYGSTLDILWNVAKTINPNSQRIKLKAEHIECWFTGLLPLLFHDNRSIQDLACSTAFAHLPLITNSEYRDFPMWPAMLTKIVDTYAVQTIRIMKASNSNWKKIWDIFVRILYKEMITKPIVLNTFLNMVEIGFNINKEFVADSYLCWKVIIKLFSRNNILFTTKRLNLICKPFRPIYSRSRRIAQSKFNVWWYLICQINTDTHLYIDSVILPFFTYCFTKLSFKTLPDASAVIIKPSTIEIYKELIIPSIIGMISMMTNLKKLTNDDDELFYRKLFAKYDLEVFPNEIDDFVLHKCSSMLIKGIFEIANIYNEQQPQQQQQQPQQQTSNNNNNNNNNISNCLTKEEEKIVFKRSYPQLIQLLLNRIKYLNDLNEIEKWLNELQKHITVLIKEKLPKNKQLLIDVFEMIGLHPEFLLPITTITTITTDSNDDNGEHVEEHKQQYHDLYNNNENIQQLIKFIQKFTMIMIMKGDDDVDAVDVNNSNVDDKLVKNNTKEIKKYCLLVTNEKLDQILRNLYGFKLVYSLAYREIFTREMLKWIKSGRTIIDTTPNAIHHLPLYMKIKIWNILSLNIRVKRATSMQNNKTKNTIPIHMDEFENINEIYCNLLTYPLDCLPEIIGSAEEDAIKSEWQSILHAYMKAVNNLKTFHGNISKMFIDLVTDKRTPTLNLNFLLDSITYYIHTTILNAESRFTIETLIPIMEVIQKKDYFSKELIGDPELNSQPRKLKIIIEKVLKNLATKSGYSALMTKLQKTILNENNLSGGLVEQSNPHHHKIDNNKLTKMTNNNNSSMDFVPITTVWKLDPSKLTEHQRERLKERRIDIPALYNDLSQSQDSMSIKAWQPPTPSSSLLQIKNLKDESKKQMETTEKLVPIPNDFSTISKIINNNNNNNNKQSIKSDQDCEKKSAIPIEIKSSTECITNQTKPSVEQSTTISPSSKSTSPSSSSKSITPPPPSNNNKPSTKQIRKKNQQTLMMDQNVLNTVEQTFEDCDDAIKSKIAKELRRINIDAVQTNSFITEHGPLTRLRHSSVDLNKSTKRILRNSNPLSANLSTSSSSSSSPSPSSTSATSTTLSSAASRKRTIRSASTIKKRINLKNENEKNNENLPKYNSEFDKYLDKQLAAAAEEEEEDDDENQQKGKNQKVMLNKLSSSEKIKENEQEKEKEKNHKNDVTLSINTNVINKLLQKNLFSESFSKNRIIAPPVAVAAADSATAAADDGNAKVVATFVVDNKLLATKDYDHQKKESIYNDIDVINNSIEDIIDGSSSIKWKLRNSITKISPPPPLKNRHTVINKPLEIGKDIFNLPTQELPKNNINNNNDHLFNLPTQPIHLNNEKLLNRKEGDNHQNLEHKRNDDDEVDDDEDDFDSIANLPTQQFIVKKSPSSGIGSGTGLNLRIAKVDSKNNVPISNENIFNMPTQPLIDDDDADGVGLIEPNDDGGDDNHHHHDQSVNDKKIIKIINQDIADLPTQIFIRNNSATPTTCATVAAAIDGNTEFNELDSNGKLQISVNPSENNSTMEQSGQENKMDCKLQSNKDDDCIFNMTTQPLSSTPIEYQLKKNLNDNFQQQQQQQILKELPITQSNKSGSGLRGDVFSLEKPLIIQQHQQQRPIVQPKKFTSRTEKLLNMFAIAGTSTTGGITTGTTSTLLTTIPTSSLSPSILQPPQSSLLSSPPSASIFGNNIGQSSTPNIHNNNNNNNNNNDLKTTPKSTLSFSSAHLIPTNSNELLTFSKPLPPATASPSCSILKRKRSQDDDSFQQSQQQNNSISSSSSSTSFALLSSLPENQNQSQSQSTTSSINQSKRKRVNFPDPPVSTVKEYVRNQDEYNTNHHHHHHHHQHHLNGSNNNNNKSNGNNNNNGCSPTTQQFKKTFKIKSPNLIRNSRIHSMIEIARFNQQKQQQQQQQQHVQSQPHDMLSINERLGCFPSVPSMASLSSSSTSVSSSLPSSSIPLKYQFQTNDDILKYIFNEYSIDDLMEKYFSTLQKSHENQNQKQTKIIKSLTKQLLNAVQQTNTENQKSEEKKKTTTTTTEEDGIMTTTMTTTMTENGNDDMIMMDVDGKSTKIDNQSVELNINYVLEKFSEKYPQEFLQTTIQENVHKQICDKLPINSIFNYFIEKFQQQQQQDNELKLKLFDTIKIDEIIIYLINRIQLNDDRNNNNNNNNNNNDDDNKNNSKNNESHLIKKNNPNYNALKLNVLNQFSNLEIINYLFDVRTTTSTTTPTTTSTPTTINNNKNSTMMDINKIESNLLDRLSINHLIEHLLKEIDKDFQLKSYFYNEFLKFFKRQQEQEQKQQESELELELESGLQQQQQQQNKSSSSINETFLKDLLPNKMTNDQIIDYIKLIMDKK